MGKYVGFDPGGAGSFGWCVLEGDHFPLEVRGSGNVDHASQALDAALAVAGAKVDGIGIDAPLFWRSDGGRRVDQIVRDRMCPFGAATTVLSVNSLQGACLVQGVAVALLARQVLPGIPISESHPKAMLRLLGFVPKGKKVSEVSWDSLNNYFIGPICGVFDHARDAALGALSAYAMTTRLSGWSDIFEDEKKSDHAGSSSAKLLDARFSIILVPEM